jgi:hypothetical protein
MPVPEKSFSANSCSACARMRALVSVVISEVTSVFIEIFLLDRTFGLLLMSRREGKLSSPSGVVGQLYLEPHPRELMLRNRV